MGFGGLWRGLEAAASGSSRIGSEMFTNHAFASLTHWL